MNQENVGQYGGSNLKGTELRLRVDNETRLGSPIVNLQDINDWSNTKELFETIPFCKQRIG